jgi:undecaprenyl-diphosphatase
MSLGLALLLGCLQGLTEFLPVSSSGHLRLLEHWGGEIHPAIFFDILLHVGTLAAVFFVYRALFRDMTRALWRVLRGQSKLKDESHARLFVLACVATVPTGLIAIAFGDSMEGFAHSTGFVGAMLIVNGFLLLGLGFLQKSQGESGGRPLEELNVKDALVIGSIQGLGIFRGISRSGSTITAGLGLKLNQEAAATFSFVMSVPAILGALVMKMDEATRTGIETHVLVLGAVMAAIVGTVALIVLLKLLKRGRLHHFAWYCFAIGLVALLGS